MPYVRVDWSDGNYSLREIGTEMPPPDLAWNDSWIRMTDGQVRAWQALMDQNSVMDGLLSHLSNDRFQECEDYRKSVQQKPVLCPGYVYTYGGPCHLCARSKEDHRAKQGP